MVWISDPTLSRIDDELQQQREQRLTASTVPPAPAFSDWGAFDAAALDTTPGYIYEDGSLSGGGSVQGAGLLNPWEMGPLQAPPGYYNPDVIDRRGAPPPNWQTPSGGQQWLVDGWQADPFGAATDEAYFQTQPTVPTDPWSDWGAQDRAWFDTQPTTPYVDQWGAQDAAALDAMQGQNLGDWIYKYNDWGPQQDRAQFQLTPPDTPMAAEQQFLYDPPKINPANIQWGTSNWLNEGLKGLGQAGQFVNDYTLKPLGIDAGEVAGQIDTGLLRPLDYFSEIGADTAPILWNNQIAEGLKLPYQAAQGIVPWSTPDLSGGPSPAESFTRSRENLTDYSGAVEDFRNRPLAQQLLYGTIYDPTSLLPVVGYGTDIKNLIRGAGANVDELANSATLRRVGEEINSELGARQIGRVGSLNVGDVVQEVGTGRKLTVSKKFEGTINGWVNTFDEAGNVVRLKRGFVEGLPEPGVLPSPGAIDQPATRAAEAITPAGSEVTPKFPEITAPSAISGNAPRRYQEADLGFGGAEAAISAKREVESGPGAIGSLIDRSPLGKPARAIGGVVNPSLGMEETPLIAFKAKAAVLADLGTEFAATRKPLLDQVDNAFREIPAYIGPEANPIKGTLLDIAQNPQDYILTPAQRAALDAIDVRNTDMVNLVRSQYGADIGLYGAKNEGGIYLPNVNRNEDLLKRLNTTEESLAARGIAKERVWDTARDRMMRDPQFQPETGIGALLDIHDNALASAASKETFKLGSGGRTRLEVLDELKPGLADRYRKAQNDLINARARLKTAEARERIAGKSADELDRAFTKITEATPESGTSQVGRLGTVSRQESRKIDNLRAERMARPAGSEPVRISMPPTGKALTDAATREQVVKAFEQYIPDDIDRLKYLDTALRNTDKRAEVLTQRGGKAARDARQIRADIRRIEKELETLSPAYRNANIQPYVMNKSTFRYHLPEDSASIDELLRTSNGVLDKPLAAAEMSRASVLGSDISPLTIQGQLNLFRSPLTTVQSIVKMASEGGANLDVIARQEPELVKLFTQSRMRALGNVSDEFSARRSWVARLPKVGGKMAAAEDRLQNVTSRMDYETWKKTYAMLKRFNPEMSDNKAAYEAANAVSKSVPGLSTADRGASVARSQLERAAITSTSFLSSPALLAKDATSGLAKFSANLATSGNPAVAWRSMRGREQVALIHATNIVASISALSAATAYISAESNGRSGMDAVQRALTPGSRDFWAVHVGTRRVPIGGPFRSFAQGLTPYKNNRQDKWQVPDVVQFGRSKLAPAVGTSIDLLQNRDWMGDSIMKGDKLESALRAVEYFIEQTALPLTVGAIPEGIRQGKSPGDIAENAAAQAAGANVTKVSDFEQLNIIARKAYGEDFFALDKDRRDALIARDDNARELFDKWQRDRLNEAQGNVDPNDLRTIDFERRANEVNRIEGERTVNQQAAWQEYQDALAAAPNETERMKLGADFRNTIADIQSNAAMEKRGVDAAFRLFKDTGELPTDPKERAKVEYYNLFDQQGMKGPDGKLDGEKFAAEYEKLAASWTPELRAYIENDVRGQQYNIPEVEQMQADQKAIADSGYFDLEEGKREFRQANPEIAALVRKWGYSATSIAAEDLTNRTAEQQQVDDTALQNKEITPEEWRDNYRKRQDMLRAGKDVLYAGLKDDGEPTEPLDQWFAQIDAAQMPNGVDVDWDKVDAWVASQPANVQEVIDNYTGTALTPLVAEYRADVKTIANSGYWDVRDIVFDYWIQSLGMEAGAIKEDAYFDLVRQQYTKYAEDYLTQQDPEWRSKNPNAAAILATPLVASLQSKFQSGVTKANQSFREQVPDVAWLLRKWGYAGTGKEEVGKALSGG